MNNGKSVTIHQTVHGYRDGHQLLQSSTSLDRESSRTMLLLSDLSGTSVQKGFESYLTGYFLPNSQYYVLARSWYASEMPRPGCVWTHSLLVTPDDLTQLPDLSLLNEYFVRPTTSTVKNGFGSSFEILMSEQRPGSNSTISDSEAILSQWIAFILYENQHAVVVLADRAEKFEHLVLAIWNQQWPDLRKSFDFCTGSLANRQINGKPAKLQVAPRSTGTIHFRPDKHETEIIDSERKPTQPLPDWTASFATGLKEGPSSALSGFIRDFGGEFGSDFSAMPGLTRIFSALTAEDRSEVTIERLVEDVATVFPAKTDAVPLKQYLFDPQPPSRGKQRWSSPEILVALVQTQSHAAYSSDDLRVRERARTLVAELPDLAITAGKEAIRKRNNPIRREFLAGLIEGSTLDLLFEIADTDERTLVKLLHVDPAILESEKFWIQISKYYPDQISSLVSQLKLSESALLKILEILLWIGRYNYASEIASALGNKSVASVLRFFNSSLRSPDQIHAALENFLNGYPDELLLWFNSNNVSPRLAVFYTRMFDPHDSRILYSDFEGWLNVSNFLEDLEAGDRLEVACYLLVLGFLNMSGRGAELVANAFQLVYDAAKKSELTDINWRRVGSVAPTTGWFGSWDMCQRLRYSLIDNFAKHSWSGVHFNAAIKKPGTWDAVLRTADDSYHGRRFLRSLAEELAANPIEISASRSRDLLKYL